METGDGLLARVRTSGGRLTLDQAAAIAEAALACGNGAISLSARGNLQVRGVSERTLPELQARLGAAGLIDSDPEVERLRNILASPLSDIDRAAAFDLSPYIAALEARLAEDGSLRPLPAKFSFILDADGRLPVGDIDADIRFEAARETGGPSFAAYLAGDDALAALCAPAEVADAASRLARAFLSLAGLGEGALRRMRALVERAGAKAVFAAAGLEAEPRPRRRRRTSLGDVLGGHAFGAAIVVGAAAPFGDIEAAPSQGAHRACAGAWGERSAARAVAIVFRHRPCAKGGGVLRRRAARDSASSPIRGDPRLRVVACPGAPACMHALRPSARGRDALGGASAQGRGRRSACERLRQRLRQAPSDRGDAHRDRERV